MTKALENKVSTDSVVASQYMNPSLIHSVHLCGKINSRRSESSDDDDDDDTYDLYLDNRTSGAYSDKVRLEPIHEDTQHGETILEASLNLAEWMLQHQVKESAMDELLKSGMGKHLPPKHMHNIELRCSW